LSSREYEMKTSGRSGAVAAGWTAASAMAQQSTPRAP
jgi:hypothetical protein